MAASHSARGRSPARLQMFFRDLGRVVLFETVDEFLGGRSTIQARVADTAQLLWMRGLPGYKPAWIHGPAPRESYRLNAGRLMSREFVERRDESFYLIGSRVPLAHIVREFQRGESPEAIRSHYPALSLEQVYGAITFYLGSRKDVEADIAEREREEDAFTTAHPTPPEVRMTFERMQQSVSRRS